MDALHHERLYRSDDQLHRLASKSIAICGCGAIGANLADTLTRMGATQLTLIDKDRVEARNLGTQPWQHGDIGARKAPVLAGMLTRSCSDAMPRSVALELTNRNVKKLLMDCDIVIDAFDNSASRRMLRDYAFETGVPTLHVGLSGDYAEIIWNHRYVVPNDIGLDPCNYPLARNIVTLAVSVAAEVILRFLAYSAREDYTITLRDFAVRQL